MKIHRKHSTKGSEGKEHIEEPPEQPKKDAFELEKIMKQVGSPQINKNR